MKFDITNPIYNDDDAARAHLEETLWPYGPVCPHCKSQDATALHGAKHRKGLYQCNACRQQFSVTVGTVFERSKVGLHKWVLCTHLMAASKKGISAKQIERMIGVTYKTAWFMMHRIREAMAPAHDAGPVGGHGRTVEADETFVLVLLRSRQRKLASLRACFLAPHDGPMTLAESPHRHLMTSQLRLSRRQDAPSVQVANHHKRPCGFTLGTLLLP